MFKKLFERLLGDAGPEFLPAKFVVIDVRSTDEFNSGHVEGAVNLGYSSIAQGIAKVCPDKSQRIYLYCRSGGRASMAQAELARLGYTDVYNAGNERKMQAILERTKAQLQNSQPHKR